MWKWLLMLFSPDNWAEDALTILKGTTVVKHIATIPGMIDSGYGRFHFSLVLKEYKGTRWCEVIGHEYLKKNSLASISYSNHPYYVYVVGPWLHGDDKALIDFCDKNNIHLNESVRSRNAKIEFPQLTE